MLASRVPSVRRRVLNRRTVRAEGAYVLYWMIAARRTTDNFALDRAVELAVEYGVPLVVLEALRVGHDHACDRFHRFVIDGMRDNAAALSETPVRYYPYVEERAREGKGLLAALAERAVAVVTDDFPGFFLGRMLASAAEQLSVPLEVVDSNGVVPLHAVGRPFARAVDFRRHLQAILPAHLAAFPSVAPAREQRLRGQAVISRDVLRRWPPASSSRLAHPEALISGLPIRHAIGATDDRGGCVEAARRLGVFVGQVLPGYGIRDEACHTTSSGLSPHLHFGHVSSHTVLKRLAEVEEWSPGRLAARGRGQRHGYWGMSEPAEAFLDELVVWRELAYNAAVHLPDFDRYESLPAWARQTLAEHESDLRPSVYSVDRLERAETHDEVWNAAQRQLVISGRMHSYLRMLWGKKILEWSPSPQDALRTMLLLNDRYATDGRDPNSVSGVFWCLGRYDRAWGPERPIYGKIRYMSSDSARRKFRLEGYLRKWAA